MNNNNSRELQFKQLEQLANLGYWEWYPNNNKLIISDGLKNTLNFLEEKINTKNVISFLKNNSQYNECTKFINYLRALKNENLDEIITFAIILSNQKKYFEVNSQKISGNNNETYYTGVVQEVTERVKYNILKEKEIKFEKKISQIASRFLQDNNFKEDVIQSLSDIGLILESSQVKIIKIDNNKVKEQYYWKNESIKSTKQSFIKILPPSEIMFFIELLKEKKILYFNNAQDVPEFASKAKGFFNKTKSTSLIISSININNQTIGALLITRNKKNSKWDFSDIHIVKMTSIILSNALKQNIIQKKLRTSEKRLQFALLAGNLGTWELNVKENTFYFDEKYANMFGLPNSTLNRIPNWLFENIHPIHIQLYENALEECIEGSKKYYDLELKIKCKYGNYKWINDWGIVTSYDENGFPLKMVGITQDISKRKSMEDELMLAKSKAEHNEKLKSAFLANVSHEIRTPMNGISGFAELLYNNEVSENEKHKCFEIIWKNSTRLLELINNIVDISRLDTDQILLYEREYHINNILDDVEKLIHRNYPANKNVTLVFFKYFTDQSGYISIDESRIKQILKNIISNAIKFTNNGSIEVRYYLNNEGLIEFSIKDTGSGIDDKQFNTIFKRFTQTENAIKLNKGGSGLGLPITKGLIDLMNGNIWFNSKKSIGSTFYFTIPYKPTRLKVESLD